MPNYTPRHALPYPAATDSLDTVDDTLKALAETLDEKLDLRTYAPTGLKYVRNVAMYEENTTNLTGWIAIQTNLTMADLVMMRVDIRGYTYSAINNIIDLAVTGYGYGPDNGFYSVDVNNRGSCQFQDIRLTTRNSDGKIAILIGVPEGTNGTWTYPKLIVDAYLGYSNVSVAKASTGWSISRITAATVTANYTTRTNGTANQNSWRTLPLNTGSGWANYGDVYQTARYKKVAGIVYVQGLVKTGNAGTHISTLPTGFLPASRLIFSANCGSGSGRVDVDSGGNLIHQAGTTDYFSLSNIQFPAEA